MSARETRKPKRARRGSEQPSVVGATLRDVSSRLSGRGLPRGGLREQDGLKVAEGALPDSTFIGGVTDKSDFARRMLRIVAVASGALILILVAFAIAMAILANTSAFAVTGIETFDSEHITAEEVARLADIDEGVTLFNVDSGAIEEGVKRNPWVASVDVERVFPDKLRLNVHERTLGAVVSMSAGGIAWLLGDDNVWIEPLKFEVSKNQSANDVALEQASSLGVILIADVPASVSPSAGSPCTDEAIQAVMSVASQLSDEFTQRIVCYSASSEDDISLTLENGIEISFGSDSSVAAKEEVASRIMNEYGGQITYINVRIPSRPTYRRVDSEYVREGSGATGNAVEEESVVPKVLASDEGEEDSEKSNSKEGDADASTTSSTDDQAYTDDSSYGYGTDDYSGYDAYGYDSYGYDSSYGYDESYY